MASHDHAHIDDGIARHNSLVLAGGQMLGGACATIVMTLGGIIGTTLAPDPAWATLPITSFVLGQALTTVPAGMYMRRIGRRLGFMAGSLFAVAGGLVGTVALILARFDLFLLATLLCGCFQAHIQYYRFAAADMASPAFQPKAISWVLIGGVAAAILGPQLVIYSRDLLSPVTFAGSFLTLAIVACLSFGLMTQVRGPALALQSKTGGRPLSEILRQPRLLVAIACGMISYSMMSLVMTAAPIAMLACNYGVADAALAIQWHALAMFAPGFFTGNLIVRFGKETVTAAGMVLLAGCGVVALTGLEISHFWGALILLGLGWNFAFVGATSMVADCYRPEERNKVQTANEFAVFASVAFASFLSGRLMSAFGWETVNYTVFPMVLIALALIFVLILRSRTASDHA
ncbi:MAG: MFS transporter [Rhodobiaceae bacterium]|nr:MFS transporter [Rhodobiaceae bacterium]MCC0048697.1 MFS transporter [Rhodobiaceae bacterium]